mmetsp:Transcript_4864/g.6450  ORF Transcript_4864/g.6450 Transcript_4864/m.6450 type:complete len:84 (-) Transcript_4864:13-264(-)
MMEVETHEYGLDLHTCPAELCVDNGAMIAWNGWELKQAEQDVCVRERVLEGHKKVPLGNYLIDHLIMSKRYLAKKRSSWRYNH